MNRMPKYCNKFLDIIYEVLKSYKRICHNTFSSEFLLIVFRFLYQSIIADRWILMIVRIHKIA